MEIRFSRLPISGGVAFGRACLLAENRHCSLPVYKVSGREKERERARLEAAISATTRNLDALVQATKEKVGAAEAEIFRVQKMILLDAEVRSLMMDCIDAKGVNAEVAVATTLDSFESRIQEAGNGYLRQRATDIGEIKHRMLDSLRRMSLSLKCADQEHCRRGLDRIIIAKELHPLTGNNV